MPPEYPIPRSYKKEVRVAWADFSFTLVKLGLSDRPLNLETTEVTSFQEGGWLAIPGTSGSK